VTSPRDEPLAPDARLDDVFSAVYDALRRVAHRHLRGERPEHTLGTTGLVHEAWLDLPRLDRCRALRRVRRRVVEAATLETFRVRQVREDLVRDPPVQRGLRRELVPVRRVVRPEAFAFTVRPLVRRQALRARRYRHYVTGRRTA
jgi:hypothetical protein